MKKKRFKIKPLLISLFLIYVVIAFFQQQVAINKLENRRIELLQKEAEVTKENKILNEQLKYSQSDNFIENIAREKLGLVKKGEIVYIDIAKSKEVGSNSTNKK
ncbi:MAG: FtsB family cell division protein [Thermoanaerobacteraceae bacterium]